MKFFCEGKMGVNSNRGSCMIGDLGSASLVRSLGTRKVNARNRDRLGRYGCLRLNLWSLVPLQAHNNSLIYLRFRMRFQCLPMLRLIKFLLLTGQNLKCRGRVLGVRCIRAVRVIRGASRKWFLSVLGRTLWW